LTLARGRLNLGAAALALAACNDAVTQSVTEELQKRFPNDTGDMLLIVPLTRALSEMNRGNTAQAIDATQPAMRFEFGLMAGFWLTYIRGQIYLRGKSGKEAAAEFQKILDHR